MARFVSLVVAAMVLAGCGAGGKAGPPVLVAVLTSGPAGTVSFTPSASTIYYCQTPPYTAGANQGALMSVQLDCAGVPANSYFAVKAAYNDGANDVSVGWYNWVYNASAAAQQLGAWSTVYTPLSAGTTYVFELQMSTTSVGICFCDVTAEIIQQ